MFRSHIKRKFLVIFSLLLLGTFGCSSSPNETLSEPETESASVEVDVLTDYDKTVESFEEIDVKKFHEKIATGDKFFVYFGRGTCPYCRDFVPDLKKIAEEKQIDIYYLDTENTEIDPELKEIRNQFNVEFVPTLLYIQNGKTEDTFSNEESLDLYFERNS